MANKFGDRVSDARGLATEDIARKNGVCGISRLNKYSMGQWMYCASCRDEEGLIGPIGGLLLLLRLLRCDQFEHMRMLS